jgi:hypothetical protein
MKIKLHDGPLDGQVLEVRIDAIERVTDLILIYDSNTPVLYEMDESLEEEQQHPLDDRMLFYNPDKALTLTYMAALADGD